MVDFDKLGKDMKVRRDVLRMLEPLKEEVAQCEDCGLSLLRNKTVFSRGNPSAEIVVIGEGPSDDDDKQGAVFVGRTGKLVDRILETMGWQERDVYMMNTVKCRACKPQPSKSGKGTWMMNRAPDSAEIAACAPFFERQLSALPRKRIAICFGSVSGHVMLGLEQGEAYMSGLRGKLFQSAYYAAADKEPLPILITYHPSYLLRNPEEKYKVYSDLKLAQKFLKEGRKMELRTADAAKERGSQYTRQTDKRPWGKLLPTQKDKYTTDLIPV